MNDPIRTPPHTCAHCGRKSWRNHRRLCRPCYNTPEVREKYPTIVADTNCLGNGIVRNQAGAAVAAHDAPPPHEPTDAPPGSDEKVRVMEERVCNGRQPFHPLDGLNARKPKLNGRGCK